METWKILVITLSSAIVLGCVVGVFLGKRQVKKMSGQYKPLLTVRERIIYSFCILLGAGCVMFGVFYEFPVAQAQDDGMLVTDGGMLPPDSGENPNFKEEPNIGIDPAIDAFAEDGVTEDSTEETTEEAVEEEAVTEEAVEAPAANYSATPRRSGGVATFGGQTRSVRIR